MNTGTDAIRSVQRYVAAVLNEPPLAEAEWTDATPTTYRWSPGLIGGDFPVDGDAWRFLLTRLHVLQSRTHDGVEFSVYHLGDDPGPAAQAAGLTLPTTGDTIPATTLERETWDVVLWGDRADPTYPFCIVKEAGPSLSVGHALYADVTQPMHLTAYPSDAVDDVRAAVLAAERCRDQLERGIATGVGLGRPRRIPLYDYDLAGSDEPSDVRGPYDFLRVVDFGAELLPEPSDPTQVAVVADLRVTWRRDGGVLHGHRIAKSVRTEFVNP